jgi:hypothetical protein
MEYLTGKEWKNEAGEYKQWTLENKTLIYWCTNKLYEKNSSQHIIFCIFQCLLKWICYLQKPTSLTMGSGWPSFKTNRLEFHTALWIILAVTGISICSPLLKTPLSTVVLDCFLSSMKGLSSTNWSPSPWFFYGLGVMKDAAKPNCILPVGDNGSLNGGTSSGELIIIEINTESEYNSNLQIGMELSNK